MTTRTIDSNDNVAKWFAIISSSIEIINKATGMSKTEIVEKIKQDLMNEGREGYTKQITQITINGLSLKKRSELIKYLDRIVKRDNAIEKRKSTVDAAREERKRQKEEKKLEEREHREQEEAKKRQEKLDIEWAEISQEVEEMIEKQSNKDKMIDKLSLIPQIWRIARDKYIENKKDRTSIGKEILFKMNEEIYYQEVRYVTKDFTFLAAEPFIVYSTYGFNNRNFKDLDNYYRFTSLRSKINSSYTETDGIIKLLQSTKTDKTTRRILEERQKVIEREKTRIEPEYEI